MRPHVSKRAEGAAAKGETPQAAEEQDQVRLHLLNLRGEGVRLVLGYDLIVGIAACLLEGLLFERVEGFIGQRDKLRVGRHTRHLRQDRFRQAGLDIFQFFIHNILVITTILSSIPSATTTNPFLSYQSLTQDFHSTSKDKAVHFQFLASCSA